MSYRGHKVLQHGGNINGFSAMISFVPDKNIGFAFLTNGEASKIQTILLYTLLDMLLELEPIDWNSRINQLYDNVCNMLDEGIKQFKESCVKDTKPSFDLKDYVGTFLHPAYGKVEFTYENDQLIFKNGLGNLLVEHLCINTFAVETSLEGQKFFLPLEF